jgi:hypothetical protein
MAEPRSKYETQSAAPTQRRSRYEMATPTSAPSMRAAPKVKDERSWADTAVQAIQNAPGSAVAFGKSMYEAVTNPVETAGSLFDLAAGSAELGLKKVLPKQAYDFYKKFETDPASAERAMETARQVGGVYKQRYGSIEALKRTIATDPVGAAADLSTIFSGGAGVARGAAKVTTRVAPPVSAATNQVANVLSKAADYTNPVNVLNKPAGVAVRAIERAPVALRRFVAPKSTAYMQAAEGKGPQIVQQLRAPDIELVPGSIPTAAQAASPLNVTQFSALGASAEKALPTLYYQRDLASEAARQSAVQSVGKTPADIAKAETARTAATTPLYKAADKVLVPADADFTKLLDRPSMNKVLSRASELAKEKGVQFQIGQNRPAQSTPSKILNAQGQPMGNIITPAQVAQYSGDSLHMVKLAFDDLIKTPERFGIGASEARAIAKTRGNFLNWFETKVPPYGQARTTFADMSKPINQMQVGQYLEGKLATPLDVGERANVFAGALKDAPGTIKRATTNEARFKALTDILTPAQVKIVESIRDDLARAAKTKQQAKLGAEAAPKATQLATMAQRALQAPNMLSRAAMIAQNIMSRLRGQIDSKLAIQLALEMLDPKAAANALEKAMRAEAQAAKIGQIGAAPVRAAGGALRAPATLAAERTANAMVNAQTYNDTYYDDYDNYSPR